MRAILQKKALRYVFGANMISMLGSGMNSAAVAWYILQATHSEVALGMFAVLQTLPAMLMLPFTGVLIDREDRRRLVMMLDAARAVIIFAVAILAFTGKVKVWQLYVMNTLVAAGFWMFWPTITALIQELTPGEEFVHANTFLLAGIQGGWLIAGSIVGFVYNHIGLGGVLLIDFSTYLASFLLYLGVRKGRHVVPRPAELRADILVLSVLYAPALIASVGARRSIAISMGLLAIAMIVVPLSPWLAVAVAIYAIMGSGRGVSGVAMNTSIMEQVPQHFMGRVQNTFYFAGTMLQIILGFLVGAVAQWNLAAGFAIIGMVYAVAFVTAVWPVAAATPVLEVGPVEGK